MQGHAVDYTSFLRVFEDGNIWWLWRDAVRLGAGFLPVYDNRTMEVVLQPPDDLARVNERELIGAAKDARLNIELPKKYSRDGCNFVEAENFLRWLDRYIAQTGSEGIAFPEELENLVKVRKLEAAASHPSKKEFESLTQALEGWFDKKLEELPEDLRQRVDAEIGHWPPWDILSANQRRESARQSDYWNDPATEPERKFWWDHFVQLEKLEDELSGLEAISAVSAEGFMQKEARCKELRREIARMEKIKEYPSSKGQAGKKPGRSRKQLSLGLEAFYLKKLDEGQTDILQCGRIDAFVEQLRLECEDCDKIAEHILKVKKMHGEWRVYVQDPPNDGGKYAKKNEKPEGYEKPAVSKILSRLRKQYPIA